MEQDHSRPGFYLRVWRWHFFAALLVIPMSIMLAITGAIYLFNAEYNHFIEHRINDRIVFRDVQTALPADELVAAVMAEYRGAKLRRYILPKSKNDPTIEIELKLKDGTKQFLWVNRYRGTIAHSVSSYYRFMHLIKKFHGELLGGQYGAILVEMAACWMIIMILTGLYLWWPRSRGWRAVLFPKLMKNGVFIWKNLHGVIGLFASVFILLFLLSGLPWTSVWGAGFKYVQEKTGTAGPGQEFRVTLQSSQPVDGAKALSLQQVVEKVEKEALPHPVQIQFPKGKNGVWTVRSMVQNRPQRVTVHYDKWTGDEVMRIGFSDYPALKQVVSYGIAMHEGHLFGWLNQVLGVVIALCVVVIGVSGFLIIWKRRPKGRLQPFVAPPLPQSVHITRRVIFLILLLSLLLPLVGASLLVVWFSEKLFSILFLRNLKQAS